MRSDNLTGAKINCGCWILVMLINISVGAWSVNLLFDTFLNKTIPLIGAIVIGLVAGEITIPIAIVVWVLKIFHVL
jgi:hypothetical protein